jgi:hypothetical protein
MTELPEFDELPVGPDGPHVGRPYAPLQLKRMDVESRIVTRS